MNYDGKTVASIDSAGKVTISDFIGGKTDTSRNRTLAGNNKSGLVTGTQWDTIVKWSGVGNNQKNIKNMEGNIWELASEVSYPGRRVTRGNNVTAEGTKVTVAHRNSCGITQKWGDVGFRVVLYVE